MDQINKVKSLSIWIFIVPFVAVNTCLILITQFQGLFPNQADIIHNTIPYFDGGASISRTARPYPSWLIFKPAMFFTSFLLVKYWLYNKHIIQSFDKNHKYLNKVVYFGIASAVALTIHSIFLGIKFDNSKAIILSNCLDKAIEELLLNKKSPSRKKGEIDNRGSHFYLSLYWAKALSNQNKDLSLKREFQKIFEELSENEIKIFDELLSVQGNIVELGGYYKPDLISSNKIMKPSPIFNEIINNLYSAN